MYNPQFSETPAMIDQNWITACFENRHVFTRFACHGFLYVLCSDKSYHSSAHDTCLGIFKILILYKIIHSVQPVNFIKIF
jgi:hypothetical protein